MRPNAQALFKSRSWVEISAAVCAIAISAASLFIAVRQNALMEKQLSASIWPVLEFGTSNLDDQGIAEVSLEVRNAGLGPARVRSFVVRYDGKVIANARELLKACCSGGEKLPPMDIVTSSVNHSMLTANEKIRFLRFKSTPEHAEYWHRLDKERAKVSVLGCYCSALEECWMLDSTKDEQQRVASCPVTQDPNYSG